MRKWVLLLAFIAMVWPATASAQTPEDDDKDSALIRINSDALIVAGEEIDTLVVINGDAVIEGRVAGSLLVIDGDATISGTVDDDVTVISGDVHLLNGATVDNVNVIRGDVDRAAGATVLGKVDENDFSGWWAAVGVFSALLWVGMTVAALVSGIVFALVGGRQLTAAATVMTGEAMKSILGTIFLAIGLPILAVLAIVTVIGLPLGLGILVFLLPALGFLGYLVAATRIGTFLTGAIDRGESGHPVLAVVIGVILLQLVVLLPVLGGILVFLISIWGAGALATVAYRAARGRSDAAAVTAV